MLLVSRCFSTHQDRAPLVIVAPNGAEAGRSSRRRSWEFGVRRRPVAAEGWDRSWGQPENVSRGFCEIAKKDRRTSFVRTRDRGCHTELVPERVRLRTASAA